MLRFAGLGFRPMPPTENVESTLIWYRGTDSENFKHWVDSLQHFLKGNHPYKKSISLRKGHPK